MIPRFALVRPDDLPAAVAAWERAAGDGAYYAGGTELLQVMKMGLAQYATLIDLKRLPELRGIEVGTDGWLRIGSTSTHREIERSPAVASHTPALADLERHVANVRVRNTGTLGGNLAFAEPHSDPATFLLAAGATVTLSGPGGPRTLPIGEFVLGPLFTALEPGEILVEIRVPPRRRGEGRAYEKIAFFERPAASVAVRVAVSDGSLAETTVAVGSITEQPMVVAAAGEALVGADATAAIAALDGRRHTADDPVGQSLEALADVDVVADLNGSADYKREITAVLLRRALGRALREAVSDA